MRSLWVSFHRPFSSYQNGGFPPLLRILLRLIKNRSSWNEVINGVINPKSLLLFGVVMNATRQQRRWIATLHQQKWFDGWKKFTSKMPAWHMTFFQSLLLLSTFLIMVGSQLHWEWIFLAIADRVECWVVIIEPIYLHWDHSQSLMASHHFRLKTQGMWPIRPLRTDILANGLLLSKFMDSLSLVAYG